MKKNPVYLSALFIAFCMFGTASAQNTSPYWSLAGNSNASTTSKLGTTNDVSLRIYAGNVQRMMIGYSTGFVGIGTTSPTDRLHVNSASGTNAFRAQVSGNTKLLVHSNGGLVVGASATPPPNGLYVAGKTGIGTTSPLNELHVVGRGRFTTGLSIDEGGIYSVNSSGSGVVGYANTSSGTGISGSGYIGAYGTGTDYGVYGYGGYIGVYGYGIVYGSFGTTTNGTGAYGSSTGGYGVYGISTNSRGVYGYSNNNIGGYFYSVNGNGVWGKTTATTAGTYAGVFEGNVYTYGVYNSSDKSLKKNIAEIGNGLSLLAKLKPKNYEFVQDGKSADLGLPKGVHYGFIAQDMEEVLPELVSIAPQGLGGVEVAVTDPKPGDKTIPQQKTETVTSKAINYIEIIPILVKAVQEQQEQIEVLKTNAEKIISLEKEIAALKAMMTGKNVEYKSEVATLKLDQNTPNPFTTTTTIRYEIPVGAGSAKLVLTNAKGEVVKNIVLNSKGKGQVQINSSALAAGAYTYTLYADGKKSDTKQLVIAH